MAYMECLGRETQEMEMLGTCLWSLQGAVFILVIALIVLILIIVVVVIVEE